LDSTNRHLLTYLNTLIDGRAVTFPKTPIAYRSILGHLLEQLYQILDISKLYCQFHELQYVNSCKLQYNESRNSASSNSTWKPIANSFKSQLWTHSSRQQWYDM